MLNYDRESFFHVLKGYKSLSLIDPFSNPFRVLVLSLDKWEPRLHKSTSSLYILCIHVLLTNSSKLKRSLLLYTFALELCTGKHEHGLQSTCCHKCVRVYMPVCMYGWHESTGLYVIVSACVHD